MKRIEELKKEIERTQRLLSSLNKELMFEEQKEQAEKRFKYEVTKVHEKEVGEQIKSLLKLGSMVKVRGSRSRVKERLIQSLKENTFVGLHWPKCDMLTEHGYSKISHVLWGDTWISANAFLLKHKLANDESINQV